MKALLCGLLSLSALAGLQAGTAYEALRVVGTKHGDATLDRVVEVRGTRGAPQPRTWKVVVLDQGARGGVREFDVQGESIAGDRASSTKGGVPMNMNQLNLDSDGAHTVAEREAKKQGFAYDHVTYALRAGARGGSPVWELRLVDEAGGNSAVLTMAADTGKLLTTDGLQNGTAPAARVVENRRPPRTEPVPMEDEEEGYIEERRREPRYIEERRVEERRREPVVNAPPGVRVLRFFDRAGRKIGGAFEKFGDKLDRTFGSPPPRRVERRNSPPPPRRDANGTEYYRPRD